MGAWGSGSFENDDALDWLAELEDATSWRSVEEAFAAVVADDVEYREAPECAIAIAAAEVLAAASGRPAGALPEVVMRWVAAAPKPHDGLPALAIEVLDAILADSELQELWEASESCEDWKNDLSDLRGRLAIAGGSSRTH